MEEDSYAKALRELKEAIESRVKKNVKRRRGAREIPVPNVYRIVSRGSERW